MSGSSPLTRGKRGSGKEAPEAAGLIPAHAGKTPTHSCRRQKRGAHPRSRGENIWGAHAMFRAKGSSPLTRGKLLHGHRLVSFLGLIPAHAGKTMTSTACSRTRAAHPRSRGENPEVWTASIMENGSSPLTRGKLNQHADDGHSRGLIPAHAGKTRTRATPAGHFRAHPRSRGENLGSLAYASLNQGSSPLTRGKR